MSLIDNVRHTLSEAAETVAERGQQLSEIARLQVAIKRLQLERTRHLHQLGIRTYACYRGGAFAEPLPFDVVDVCRQIEDLDRQLEATKLELKDAREQARQSGSSPGGGAAGADDPSTAIVPAPGGSESTGGQTTGSAP